MRSNNFQQPCCLVICCPRIESLKILLTQSWKNLQAPQARLRNIFGFSGTFWGKFTHFSHIFGFVAFYTFYDCTVYAEKNETVVATCDNHFF